jgi:type II secretory pathway component GspD/PulD (secretin)
MPSIHANHVPRCSLEQPERGDMRPNGSENRRYAARLAAFAALCALAFAAFASHAGAQTNSGGSQPCEARPAPPETVQTIFVNNAAQQNDLNDIATDLRNVMPHAKIFPVQFQSAITLRATEEDLATAQKLIADLDKPRKLYRLTFTITDFDGDKRTGSEHYVFLAVAGMKTIFKEGSRVPIVTGMADKQTAAESSQVQYVDIGLSIEATVAGSADNLTMRSKIEQSSLAGEKSAATPADPVVHQNVLEGFTEIALNKSAVLGSLDLPGATRRQEIEVTAELVH